MTIKGILFDAAGVFYDRPESTRTYVANLLTEMGFSTELPAKDRARHKALRSQANRGRFSPSEYWDQVLLMLGVVSPADRETLIAKINAYSDQVQAIPGGREALAGLQQRGFVLGIVTDTIYPIGRKMRWLNQVGVAEFIEVSSEELLFLSLGDLLIDLFCRVGQERGICSLCFVSHRRIQRHLPGAQTLGHLHNFLFLYIKPLSQQSGFGA